MAVNELKIKNGLLVDGSGSATFAVDGTAGRLFLVNDTFSGSLFSVNTISGLPLIEAFSDNTVRIGQYSKKVLFISQSRTGFGKESGLTADVDISGSTTITGSLNVSGSSVGHSIFGPFYLNGTEYLWGTLGLTPDASKGTRTSHVHYGTNGDVYWRSANTNGFVTIQDTGGNLLIGTSTNSTYKVDIVGNTRTIGTSLITGSAIVTGSLRGAVINITPTNQTASLNCAAGNFFVLTLSGSRNTTLSATNIQPGQTLNLIIAQPTTSGTLSYDTGSFKFPIGAPYTASATSSVADLLSFMGVTLLDGSTVLFGSTVKGFYWSPAV